MTQKNNQSLGVLGEAIAAKYLIKKGIGTLKDKNIHAQGGEIDLIFQAPDQSYILVEVKMRKNEKFGDIKTSITKQKFQKILKAAEYYFLVKKGMKEVPYFRIDAVFLQMKEGKVFCEHLENLGFSDFS